MGDTSVETRLQAWVIATRPHTLPAAVAPVIVGTGFAVHDGVFALLPAVFALLGAALIQIGTNLANDYYDAEKGTDTDDRDGFTRVTASGLIESHRVKHATLITFGFAVLVGLYLVYIGGFPILVIGLASIAAGILYTGGPYPFGYYGLGDLFVFVFFGIIAVTGSYYVQAVTQYSLFPLWIPPGTVTGEVLIASLPMAGLITNILVVNNIRDIETDRAAGKRTLAVIIGYTWSRIEYIGFLGVAYLVPVWFFNQGFSTLVLAPLITLPYALALTRTLLTETTGNALDPALSGTAKLTVVYAILFVAGIII